MALEVRTVVTFEGGVITLDEVPRYRVPEMFYILFWADVQNSTLLNISYILIFQMVYKNKYLGKHLLPTVCIIKK